MKIKFRIALMMIALGSASALAQQRPSFKRDTALANKIREVYLTVGNFSPLQIDVKYKTQIDWNTFFKVGLIDLAYNQVKNGSSIGSTYSAGVLLGIEFRKNLFNKVTFFHGPNVSFAYNGANSKSTDPITHKVIVNGSYAYTAGVPYTFGLLFKLSGHFLLAAELNPAVTYSRRSNSSAYTINAGLNSANGLVSLVYRF